MSMILSPELCASELQSHTARVARAREPVRFMALLLELREQDHEVDDVP